MITSATSPTRTFRPAYGNERHAFAISTAPAFVCGINIGLTLTVTTDNGVFTFPFSLPTGSPAATSRFDSNTPAIIPDLGVVESPLL